MTSTLFIWQASVPDVMAQGGDISACLTAPEQARAARFVVPGARDAFCAARFMLRQVLADCLSCSPAAVQFVLGPEGKPGLVPPGYHFNLSHSGEMIMLAVNADYPVGIDVEKIDLHRPVDELVRRFFSAQEVASYQAYGGKDERRAAFYQGWTRKEAVLKAIGCGLSYPLSDFSVGFSDQAAVSWPSLLSPTEQEAAQLKTLSAETGYAAAVSVIGPVAAWEHNHWRAAPGRR